MTPKEAMAVLVTVFRQEKVPQATIRIYEDRLKDIGPELLEATVRQLVDACRFFPSIAEIRETAARLAGRLPISKAEALAIIRKADVSEPVYRRDGTLAYTEHFWRWPDEIDEGTRQAIQAVLAKIGDPVNFSDDKRHFGWERGFEDTYEATAKEILCGALANLSGARPMLRDGDGPTRQKALPEAVA